MTYFFLPSRPESTTCLSDRERKIAVERMNRDSSGDNGAVVNKGIRHFKFTCIFIGFDTDSFAL